MKKFNLEEYLANPNRKVITRDGRNARIIYIDAKGDYPIIALIENIQNNEMPFSYTKDGIHKTNIIDSKDLFFAPEKHEGWVNLLKNLNGNAFIGDPSIYKSKEDAEESMKDCNNYMAAIKISWEE